MLQLCAFFLMFLGFIYSPSTAKNIQSIKLEYSEESTVYREQNGFHGNYRRMKRTPYKLPLVNKNNFQYYAEVEFGSNKQKYNIMFDTGSGMSWIPKETPCSWMNKHFKSDTFEDLNTEIIISYLKEEVKMKLGSDSVTIGDMKVKSQKLGLAIKSDCKGKAYEGIIGMSLLSSNHSSIIQNMLSQGLIEKPLFAFYLNRNKGSRDSELTIGGYNPNHIQSNQLNTLKVTDPEHWQVSMEKVVFGKYIIAANQKAIIDSGSSIIAAPFKFLQYFDKIIRKFYTDDVTQENGFLSYIGNDSLKLPNVTFILENNQYTLTEKEYAIKTDQCITIGIFFNDFRSDTWVLGDSFLQKYYLIFDAGERAISFPKTRLMDESQLNSSMITDQHSVSKGYSMNINRIYLLMLLLISHKFNST